MFAPFLTVSSSLRVEVSFGRCKGKRMEIQHTYRFICLRLLCVITIERLEKVFSIFYPYPYRGFNFNPFDVILQTNAYIF